MKLFVIVQSALSAGLKCAQAVRAFVGDHPVIEKDWHVNHNNIVILQHDDPVSLGDALEARGLKLSRFWEPDLDGALTALCV